MRINEISNAQAQLGLWKLISDNTWAAVNQQAQQEARAQAEKAAARKSTPHKRGVRKSTPKAAAPKPSVPIAPKQTQTQAQTATPSVQPQPPTQTSTPVQQSSAVATGVQQANADNATISSIAKPKPNMPQGSTLMARARGVLDDAK